MMIMMEERCFKVNMFRIITEEEEPGMCMKFHDNSDRCSSTIHILLPDVTLVSRDRILSMDMFGLQ